MTTAQTIVAVLGVLVLIGIALSIRADRPRGVTVTPINPEDYPEADPYPLIPASASTLGGAKPIPRDYGEDLQARRYIEDVPE